MNPIAGHGPQPCPAFLDASELATDPYALAGQGNLFRRNPLMANLTIADFPST